MKNNYTCASLRRGFTLMEILVVVAIILVLAAIAVPAISTFRIRAFKADGMHRMKELAAATQTYINDNNGELPQEDAKGADDWNSASQPDNAKAWYNALPRQMGKRSVADYASTPREFYTKENVLFVPGATYPESDKKLVKPLFGIAINTKLQRKDADGKKSAVKMAQIVSPSRTALFIEQGLPGEKKEGGADVQKKSNYDGAPKGSAKSFVGRYGGKGFIVFVEGHIEEFEPKVLLTETGAFPFPPTDVIWTRAPEENPNK